MFLDYHKFGSFHYRKKWATNEEIRLTIKQLDILIADCAVKCSVTSLNFKYRFLILISWLFRNENFGLRLLYCCITKQQQKEDSTCLQLEDTKDHFSVNFIIFLHNWNGFCKGPSVPKLNCIPGDFWDNDLSCRFLFSVTIKFSNNANCNSTKENKHFEDFTNILSWFIMPSI